MKITVLGSGAWEGTPAPFCRCNVCDFAIKNPTSKENRTRPQLLVETGEGKFLLEASPDIRLQAARFNLPPIKDFVISHWHPDHMAGLRELDPYGKETVKGLNIYCSLDTKNILDTNEYSYLPLNVTVIKGFGSFKLAGVTITSLPVYHMRDVDDSFKDTNLENTFGYMLEHEGKRVAFLADYYRIPQSVLEIIRGADAILCDGTYMLTGDYRARKPNHMHGQEVFDSANITGAKLIYYHSVSHLTHKTHAELQALVPQGHILTYDGLKLEI